MCHAAAIVTPKEEPRASHQKINFIHLVMGKIFLLSQEECGDNFIVSGIHLGSWQLK